MLTCNRAQVGFSQNIPFPDSQFDVVIMTEVLEHRTDDVLNATLGEVKRVLKPRGVLSEQCLLMKI